MADLPSYNGTVTIAPPPPGVTVDLEHPQQRRVLEHYLLFGFGGSIALVALLQRYYVKTFLSKGLQLDDLFMFLAWASSVITQALLVRSIAQGGLGHHVWEMPLHTFKQYLLTTYIAAPMFQLCNGFAKLTLLTFYLRLSTQTGFRIAVWLTITLVTCYTIAITAMMLLMCNPIRKAFDPFIQGGSCIDPAGLFIATAATNVASDLILFLLPLPMIISLHLPSSQKVGAVFVFAIGSLTIATSCVRLAYLPGLLGSNDLSWEGAEPDVWTFVEANLFVICASFPTLRKFFRHFLPTVMGSYGRGSKGQSGGIRSGAPTDPTGGRRSRRNHDRYSEFTELRTMHSEDIAQDASTGGSVTAVRTSSETKTESTTRKVIVQTRSFSVEYEHREQEDIGTSRHMCP